MTVSIKLIFLFVFSFVYASGCGQVKTNDTTTNSNDSTPRHDELSISEFKKQVPPARGWINDFANILSDQEIKKLDSIASRFEKNTSIEIAVVTLDSNYTNANEFDNYSLILAMKWGIGKKEKNNGILIAMSPDLRRMRIRNGSGLNKLITDSETQQIIDEFSLPQFRNGLFFEGFQSTILELIKKLEEKD